MDLEEVWRIREEEVYPNKFGKMSRGIFPLSYDIFKRFNKLDPDPRWFTYGVIEYSPTVFRNSWLYATSGCSNPWEIEPEAYDSNAVSGAGVEFTFQTIEMSDWAIILLQNMLVMNLLISTGHMGEKRPFNLGDRIPLRQPINGDDKCLLRNIFVEKPNNYDLDISLPSGKARFMNLLGITDSECELAQKEGSGALFKLLTSMTYDSVTDPLRLSVVV